MAPPIARWRNRMVLSIQPACLEMLEQLKGDRLLLLANHPTYYDDWFAVFLLSGRLRLPFYYLAAHERFQGLEGQLIQRLGAYSIRRGLGDRASVTQTVKLLMQPKGRLVIFPEGGCSFQNDTVMPFRAGAVQVAMQALGKLAKAGGEVPNLYVVPLSIKYRYTRDMTLIIHQTLRRLESALGIGGGAIASLTLYQRLRRVAEKVLVQFEVEYGLAPPAADSSWNERIASIKAYLLQHCEKTLGIVSPPGKLVRERVYKIQSELESRAATLAVNDFWTYETIHRVAASLLNFDAIYDGYVAASPTPERFLDTLIRLERQVFQIDYPPPKAHRQVLIRVGTPMNLRDHYTAYRGDRSRTVNTLSEALRTTVQKNLDQLSLDQLSGVAG
ncbi:MAG: lysophospholipid acyltransferase family protein [Elainellaceae cyanobacterium]